MLSRGWASTGALPGRLVRGGVAVAAMVGGVLAVAGLVAGIVWCCL